MLGLWVFLGGGAGSVLRWWVAGLFPGPWGTVCVNVLGSVMLAFLMHPGHALSEPWRLALGTGMMGGFTTYSSFNLDLLAALQAGAWAQAGLTLLSTVGACLAGGAMGWALAGVLRA